MTMTVFPLLSKAIIRMHEAFAKAKMQIVNTQKEIHGFRE